MSSGGSKIGKFVARHQRIGFDTNILIAYIEENREFVSRIEAILEAIEGAKREVWLSVLVVPELLIQPLRRRSVTVVRDYEELLFEGQYQFAEILISTARHAAALGARYGLDAHDALHLAPLLEHRVTGFVTADRDFRRVKTPEVLIL